MTYIATMYSKTRGCQSCRITERKMAELQILHKVEIIHIDQPENEHILQELKEEGLMQAPIIKTKKPITLHGKQITQWQGLVPDAIKALKENA